MNRKGSVLIVILGVAVFVSMGLAAGSYFLYQKKDSENIQLKQQIDELNTRQRVTEGKLAESKDKVAELQLKLGEAETKIDGLTGELTQEKSARQASEAKLEQMNADLEQQKTLRSDVENQLTRAQDEGKIVKAQLEALRKQKTELELKIKQLEGAKDNVELGKVVVNLEDNPADAKNKAKVTKAPAAGDVKVQAVKPAVNALEGKVLVVNKEFNFVVFNLGSKDGVEVGNTFGLYRGDQHVGDVRVEKVHDSMSAAGFPDELKERVKENDRVIRQVK